MKVCKRCEKEKRIWSRGLCKSCDIVTNPQKYMIERKKVEKKKTESVTQLKKKLEKILHQIRPILLVGTLKTLLMKIGHSHTMYLLKKNVRI
jgi:Fe-S cluster biogenesis protein NfuA